MRYIFILLILTGFVRTQAQNTYRFGYSGQYIVHPGLSAAYEHHLKDKTKHKKEGKDLLKSNILLPQVGFYHHIQKENNFTIGLELIRHRRRLQKGEWGHEWGAGLFYMRSFNTGKTFEVIDGNVERIRGAGQNYMAPSLSYCLSRKIQLVQKLENTRIYIKPLAYFMMPYNETVVPNLNLQFGLTFTPSAS